MTAMIGLVMMVMVVMVVMVAMVVMMVLLLMQHWRRARHPAGFGTGRTATVCILLPHPRGWPSHFSGWSDDRGTWLVRRGEAEKGQASFPVEHPPWWRMSTRADVCFGKSWGFSGRCSATSGSWRKTRTLGTATTMSFLRGAMIRVSLLASGMVVQSLVVLAAGSFPPGQAELAEDGRVAVMTS